MPDSKENALEVYAETIKYMFMSRRQNVGQQQNIDIANKSIEIVG
jgi:hypothetical protein